MSNGVAFNNGLATPMSGPVHQILKRQVVELDRLRDTLKEPTLNAELMKALHDTTCLPDKDTAQLAAQAIDLLHETAQILQPGHLILADHFLGTALSTCASISETCR